MEIEYKREFHPFLETMGLIYLMKNFEEIKTEIIGSLDEMGIEGELFYKSNLSYLADFAASFEKKYIPDANDAFFFEIDSEFFLIVLVIGVYYLEMGQSTDNVSKKKILQYISTLFFAEGHSAAIRLNTAEEQIAAMEKTDFSENTKWKMLLLLKNPVEKFENFFKIYHKNQAAFTYTITKHQEQWMKLLSLMPENISAAMANVADQFTGGKILVYPTAVLPLTEWLVPPLLFQGVLTEKLDLYKNGVANAREALPPLLKILGDKSKFEILCSLKERGKYNLEIAEELQLTPATASHHMGILLSHHFVTVEKREGKVYYHLNAESIHNIIAMLEGIF